MLKSYRSMTNDLLLAHEETALSLLQADPDFSEAQQVAEDLGVSLSLSIRRPYTLPDQQTKFAYGYESELCIDVVCDGQVLYTANPDVDPTQMSLSYPLVRTPDTLLLRRIELIPFEKIIEDGTLFAMLDEYFDDIEEYGATRLSPIPADETVPDPTDPAGILTPEEAESCEAVEVCAGAFTGVFGASDSLFWSRQGFSPYRWLLFAILGEKYNKDGINRMVGEEAERFCSLLSELPLSGRGLFSSQLSELGIYHLSPTDRSDRLLTHYAGARHDAFLADTERLLIHLKEALRQEGCFTVIEP